MNEVKAAPKVATPKAKAPKAKADPQVALTEPKTEPDSAQSAPHDTPTSILGASLTELIAEAKVSGTAPAGEEGAARKAEPVVVDPATAEKLDQARPQLMELIKTRRPRFLAAFELMKIAGNRISVSVPTTELRDEIMRTRNSMLRHFIALAGINGTIELEVSVNEEIRAARPIKLEDRLKWLSDKNPELQDLCKILELNPE